MSYKTSFSQFTGQVKRALERQGIKPIPTVRDAGNNCVYCGECGRCPGVHDPNNPKKIYSFENGQLISYNP